MFRGVRAHLTYANVVATLALFVALGGGAYAAFKLPANSVGTAQIKNQAVTPAKLAQRDLVLFKGQKGDTGQQGPQGPAGTQGPEGLSTGPAGGDLTGSYPNPVIAAGAITPLKIGTIPQASATSSTEQMIPTKAGGTVLSLDTTEFDTAGMHSTAPADNWKLTAPICRRLPSEPIRRMAAKRHRLSNSHARRQQRRIRR